MMLPSGARHSKLKLPEEVTFASKLVVVVSQLSILSMPPETVGILASLSTKTESFAVQPNGNTA